MLAALYDWCRVYSNVNKLSIMQVTRTATELHLLLPCLFVSIRAGLLLVTGAAQAGGISGPDRRAQQ